MNNEKNVKYFGGASILVALRNSIDYYTLFYPQSSPPVST